MKIVLFVTFLVFYVVVINAKLHPLSDEFIDLVNSKQSTWIAGRNFDKNTPLVSIKRMLGKLKDNPHLHIRRPTVYNDGTPIPHTFDARTNWPACTDVISTIVDQSNCGSCWAVAAASAMSDRRCIASEGKLTVPVSAEDLMSCCTDCGYGCDGGNIAGPWEFWSTNGIVTGGLYNSSMGCKPYSLPTCDHHVNGHFKSCNFLPLYDAPMCSKYCTNQNMEYSSELTFGSKHISWLKTPEDIQRDIMKNGPVEAGFEVYGDFLNYKSGVYHYVAGDYEGGHAVRIIGWGNENGVDYWLIANSWNPGWGDNGTFKIVRGRNEVGIEQEVLASVPKL